MSEIHILASLGHCTQLLHRTTCNKLLNIVEVCGLTWMLLGVNARTLCSHKLGNITPHNTPGMTTAYRLNLQLQKLAYAVQKSSVEAYMHSHSTTVES